MLARKRRGKRQGEGAEGVEGVEGVGTAAVAPKRARRRVRAPRGTPLWELLPDELVQRIVGFVRQNCICIDVVYRRNARVVGRFHFKKVRLVNRALANGLHTVALMSVPSHLPDHVDAFTEGLVRLASDLFNKAQQDELGHAHVSYRAWYNGTLGHSADHVTCARVVLRNGLYQGQPQLFYSDYRRAICMHLRMLLPEGALALPTSARDKQRMIAFLAAVVIPPTGSSAAHTKSLRFAEDLIRCAMENAVSNA